MKEDKPALTGKLVLVFCFLAAVVIGGCRKGKPQESSARGRGSSSGGVSTGNFPVSEALKGIIYRRRTWNPILTNFYGKEMPDFKVMDISGKTHNLKDYRGKNVLVVMWATWCVPCLEEIPHLKALREIMPADKLAILAISSEPADAVKTTAESEGMTYTVISHRGRLPEPFSNIRGYPSAFFIRPNGTLKLVVEGGSQLGEMKAIILAE